MPETEEICTEGGSKTALSQRPGQTQNTPPNCRPLPTSLPSPTVAPSPCLDAEPEPGLTSTVAGS